MKRILKLEAIKVVVLFHRPKLLVVGMFREIGPPHGIVRKRNAPRRQVQVVFGQNFDRRFP